MKKRLIILMLLNFGLCFVYLHNIELKQLKINKLQYEIDSLNQKYCSDRLILNDYQEALLEFIILEPQKSSVFLKLIDEKNY